MNELQRLQRAAGAVFETVENIACAVHYGAPQAEHAALHETAGLHERGLRGVLDIAGADRASWLHNLVTNEIRNLQPGEGNYAFALNVKGRVVFDGCVLVADDRVLLDIDRRWTAAAPAHLGRYLIMEDVQIQDISESHARLAVVGPQLAALGAAIGLPQASAMAQFQHQPVDVGGIPVRAVRHDFCGPPAIELLVDRQHAAELWARVLELGRSLGLRPVGRMALESTRIESGLPAAGAEIDDEVIPAETRQLERAVSFNKGCYLGQEVVERMRAHSAVARLLVGLRFSGPAAHAGCKLAHDGQDVGRVTSAVDSLALHAHIGLGYVRAALALPGQSLDVRHDHGNTSCTVCDLPFKTGPAL